MSTDDLTARVRDHLAHADTLPHGLAIALVSELADEVDRLRAEADRYRTLWDRHGKNDLLAERDAARAALERVRAVRAQHPVCDVHPEDDSAACGWKRTVIDIDEALEGES